MNGVAVSPPAPPPRGWKAAKTFMDLITSHINADFDALASMMAAQKIYPGARAAFPGAQERSVRKYLEEVGDFFDFHRVRDIDLDAVKRLVVVDTKDPTRIGPFATLLERPDIEVHVYDHHPFQSGDIRGTKERIEDVAAVSTMMVELLRRRSIAVNPMEATLLALGIYEETGFFAFPSTGIREFQAMGYLLRRGANLNVVNTYLGREPNPEQMELLHDLLQSIQETIVLGVTVQVAVASRDHFVRDVAVVAHKLRDVTDTDVLFVLIRMEDRIHVVGRSRTPELDVACVLRHYGGGGHPTAASAVIRELSLEDAERDLWGRVRECVRPGKTAGDLMTRPVISVPMGATLRDTEQFLTRYSVNVLPVLSEGRFRGIVSREVVEKALHHGFAKSRVEEFATEYVPTVTPETPLSEIESLMVEHNQRFLPVVDKGAVVGAITRTDLVRSLYEDLIRKKQPGSDELPGHRGLEKNVRRLLRDRMPDHLVRFLTVAGETARELGHRVYLVGGSVRDLLRAERNLDVDLVVEGDGIVFARELAGRLGARVKGHQRFKTAVIVMPDGRKVDVATARTEYYPSPAVLPEIEASSIKKDLSRRDFTVNTLAIALNPEDFGELIDFFGGQRDLKERTIRILHNLSFVEDPTRAFRAVRFAERFGFRISRHTASLILAAVRMDLFDRLSGSRLWDELVLIFEETRPDRVVEALEKYGLLRVIHPSLKLTPTLSAFMYALHGTIAWYRLLFVEDEEVRTGPLLITGLLDELSWEDKKTAIRRLGTSDRHTREISANIRAAARALQRLEALGPKAVYHALSGLPTEGLLLAMAKTDDEARKKAISLYITELRKTEPILTGRDLRGMGYMPGPRFREIHDALIDARLDGLVATREDEERFTREHFPPGN